MSASDDRTGPLARPFALSDRSANVTSISSNRASSSVRSRDSALVKPKKSSARRKNPRNARRSHVSLSDLPRKRWAAQGLVFVDGHAAHRRQAGRDRDPLQQGGLPRPVLADQERHRPVHAKDGQRADHGNGVGKPVRGGRRNLSQLDRTEVVGHPRILPVYRSTGPPVHPSTRPPVHPKAEPRAAW